MILTVISLIIHDNVKTGPFELKFGMEVGNGMQMLNIKGKNDIDINLINYS